MRINNNEDISVRKNEDTVKEVKDIIYLGQLISQEDKCEKGIARRVRISWGICNKYRKLFRSHE